MKDNYDQETRVLMTHAIEDLQSWMANAGRDTTEAAVLGWQQGYIAGITRGIGVRDDKVAPEEA